jgi:hypothetical protein
VGVISIMLLATILNGSAAVSSGKDPIDTIVPAGVFTLVLEFLYDEVNPKVATALAGTFLLGSFMLHYTEFTNLIGYFTTPKDSKND